MSPRQQQKQAAKRLQEMLEEENSFLLLRLIQVFGVAVVEAQAQDALTYWQQAQDTGASAYVAQPNGTRVAKTDGSPRSKGGVFFQVIREHCQSIGINWLGMFPYQSPQKKIEQHSNETAPNPAPHAVQPAPKPAAPKTDVGAGRNPTAPPNTTPATKPVSSVPPSRATPPTAKAPSSAADAPTKPKSSRGKVTITGTLAGAPKRDSEKGLVELAFGIEMSASLPKGLPNLGTSRVTVICTIKQFEKLVETTPITVMSETRPQPENRQHEERVFCTLGRTLPSMVDGDRGRYKLFA